MRAPKGKRWLTILAVAFTLMFVTGAAYAISPEILSVHGTITVRIPEVGPEEMVLPDWPDWPPLPGLVGDGQAPGEEGNLHNESGPGHGYDEDDDYDYGYDENDEDKYNEDDNEYEKDEDEDDEDTNYEIPSYTNPD